MTFPYEFFLDLKCVFDHRTYIPDHESGFMIERSIVKWHYVRRFFRPQQGRCVMGGGGWDHAGASARAQERSSRTVQSVVQQDFSQTRAGCVHASMTPYGLVMRESRDSEEHPDSVAFMFGFDITGSMGGLPPMLARETLPQLMAGILPFLTDAQIMFLAFGDARDGIQGYGPLQVGQFESSDMLADECLRRIWLQGSGGSSPYESADLILYLAARHTSIDCYEKRGKKGYLYINTDDICRDFVSAAEVNALFGRVVLTEDIPIETIIKEASEKYHIFVLIPDERRANADRAGERVIDHYRRRIGNGAITLGSYQDTSIIAAMLAGLTERVYNMANVENELRTRFQKSRSEITRMLDILRPYADSLSKN